MPTKRKRQIEGVAWNTAGFRAIHRPVGSIPTCRPSLFREVIHAKDSRLSGTRPCGGATLLLVVCQHPMNAAPCSFANRQHNGSRVRESYGQTAQQRESHRSTRGPAGDFKGRGEAVSRQAHNLENAGLNPAVPTERRTQKNATVPHLRGEDAGRRTGMEPCLRPESTGSTSAPSGGFYPSFISRRKNHACSIPD